MSRKIKIPRFILWLLVAVLFFLLGKCCGDIPILSLETSINLTDIIDVIFTAFGIYIAWIISAKLDVSKRKSEIYETHVIHLINEIKSEFAELVQSMEKEIPYLQITSTFKRITKKYEGIKRVLNEQDIAMSASMKKLNETSLLLLRRKCQEESNYNLKGVIIERKESELTIKNDKVKVSSHRREEIEMLSIDFYDRLFLQVMSLT